MNLVECYEVLIRCLKAFNHIHNRYFLKEPNMTSPAENTKPLLKEKKYPRKMSSTLNAMRHGGIHTDVVLVCKDKEYPAHQLVLSAGSAYFKKMFESEFKESITKRIDFSYVKESTLVTIIDFLYLLVPKLPEENIEDLIEIHDMSHLFGVTELSDFCWKLINKHITIDNYVNIWNMRILYTDEYYFEEILSFALENLKIVVEKESFLTLNGSQMKLLMQRIHEKRIPTEDYLFERLMNWVKEDEEKRKEMLKLFYYLSYEHISKECVEKSLKENEALLRTGFMKTYFEMHVLPALKNKKDIEEHNTSVAESKFDISSLKRLYFGYDFEIKDNVICDQHDVLKIEDFASPKETADSKRLPLPLTSVQFCFYSDSTLYFVKQDSPSSPLFLTGYNWKNNAIEFESQIPQYMYVVEGCCTGNNVYLIGRSVKNASSKIIFVQCYTKSTQYWNSIKIKESMRHDDIIASVNLKGTLTILCFRKENQTLSRPHHIEGDDSDDEVFGTIRSRLTWTYFGCSVENNIQDHSVTSSFTVEGKINLDKKLIAVYKDKLYAFFVYSTKVLYCVYDSDIDHWNHFKVLLTKPLEKPIKCISTSDQGILFYTDKGNFIHFDCRENEIRPITVPKSDSNADNFVPFNIEGCEVIITSTGAVESQIAVIDGDK